jgi:hypothetical protein
MSVLSAMPVCASPVPPCRGIVPPYLLEALARHPDEHVATCARRSLDRDARVRGLRAPALRRTQSPPDHPLEHEAGASAPHADDGTHPERTISDAHGRETTPGTTVRTEGQPATGDAAADEAYDGLGATWQLYRHVYRRDSLDAQGLPLLGTVHYGQDYDNAFWDGTQMVFGDGDGKVFTRFTVAVDVIGHELTHGVTQFTAGLDYQGQSGALNESVSDVFGSLVKQRSLGQSAEEADWLIGAGLFTSAVHGVALRSMKAPGTAYDDPQLGKDPQPATMSGYVHTTDDNGGVHTNSGIPNHAFYLAAVAIGGNAWEGAGQVWYDVLTGGSLPHDADFATFAQATVAAAGGRYAADSPQVRAVTDAWVQVEVLAAEGTPEAPAPQQPRQPRSPSGPGEPVPSPSGGSATAAEFRLRRTGGLAGRAVERTVVLDQLPPDDADAWRTLFAQDRLVELAAVEPERAVPDAFIYHVAAPPQSQEVTLAEHAIPEPVRDLFSRTLRD